MTISKKTDCHNNLPKFSVVMSVYQNDNPRWINLAVDSILNQSIAPDEVIIVVDGPVSNDVNQIIFNKSQHNSVIVKRIESNRGLGNALNEGIKIASNELIARMDADDMSLPERFFIQLSEFANDPNLEILGGQLAEFESDNPWNVTYYRKVPLTMDEIRLFSKRRNPFNHPTVMYKKSAINKLGLYDAEALRTEDYDLWLKALSGNISCRNVSEVLVHYRANSNSIKRRKTLSSLKNHTSSRVRFYRKGYIGFSDLAFGISTQLLIFILPSALINIIMKRKLRVQNI